MIGCCIGITSYNCLPYLINNINSIKNASAYGDVNIHVIVNDNASTDGTINWLREEYKSLVPKLALSYSLNSFNGYASYGCHQSIEFFLKQTDADYFLHLDPDCEIRDPAAISNAIVQLSANDKLGAIGEKRFALRYKHPRSRSLKAFDEYIMGDWSHRYGPKNIEASLESMLIETHPVCSYLIYKELCGNVMMYKREVISKIGNIDANRFKMWRWDSEYSMRCLLWGYEIASAEVVESGAIYHFGGRSRLSGSNPLDYMKKVLKDTKLTESYLARYIQETK